MNNELLKAIVVLLTAIVTIVLLTLGLQASDKWRGK